MRLRLQPAVQCRRSATIEPAIPTLCSRSKNWVFPDKKPPFTSSFSHPSLMAIHKPPHPLFLSAHTRTHNGHHNPPLGPHAPYNPSSSAPPDLHTKPLPTTIPTTPRTPRPPPPLPLRALPQAPNHTANLLLPPPGRADPAHLPPAQNTYTQTPRDHPTTNHNFANPRLPRTPAAHPRIAPPLASALPTPPRRRTRGLARAAIAGPSFPRHRLGRIREAVFIRERMWSGGGGTV